MAVEISVFELCFVEEDRMIECQSISVLFQHTAQRALQA